MFLLPMIRVYVHLDSFYAIGPALARRKRDLVNLTASTASRCKDQIRTASTARSYILPTGIALRFLIQQPDTRSPCHDREYHA